MNTPNRFPETATNFRTISPTQVVGWATASRNTAPELLSKLNRGLPPSLRQQKRLMALPRLVRKQEQASAAQLKGCALRRRAHMASPKVREGQGRSRQAFRYLEVELCRLVLRSCASGAGAFKSFMNQAIMASPHRPNNILVRGIGSDFLFDTFTDHLRDLLLEWGLVCSPSRVPDRVLSTWKLRFLTRRHCHVQRRFDTVVTLLVSEALRRTFLTYAAPVIALDAQRSLGAIEAS